MEQIPEHRRTYRREPADQRREALIQAALRVVAEQGIRAASVRAIAAEAGVTPGLIRHHFQSKEELLHAAYDHHMSQLVEKSHAAADGTAPAAIRLGAFIRETLSPPVAASDALQLWAGFLQMVPRDPAMRAIHRKHYEGFRTGLERLIADALQDAGHRVAPDVIRDHAITCNAVLDGLWLEGSALPDQFDTDRLVDLGLRSVSALLKIDIVFCETPS